jgi:hypothetical protein
MAKREFEFTLVLLEVRELTREILDALCQTGGDEALNRLPGASRQR